MQGHYKPGVQPFCYLCHDHAEPCGHGTYTDHYSIDHDEVMALRGICVGQAHYDRVVTGDRESHIGCTFTGRPEHAEGK